MVLISDGLCFNHLNEGSSWKILAVSIRNLEDKKWKTCKK